MATELPAHHRHKSIGIVVPSPRRAALRPGTGTPSSMAAFTVHLPSPESATRPWNSSRSWLLMSALAHRSRSQEATTCLNRAEWRLLGVGLPGPDSHPGMVRDIQAFRIYAVVHHFHEAAALGATVARISPRGARCGFNVGRRGAQASPRFPVLRLSSGKSPSQVPRCRRSFPHRRNGHRFPVISHPYPLGGDRFLLHCRDLGKTAPVSYGTDEAGGKEAVDEFACLGKANQLAP